MGSPWNERRMEADGQGMDRLGTPPTKPGLEASELDLLRRAPDYDAEEMATVRPNGGWPASEAQAGASLAETRPIAKPAAPSWLPPNRIEPPVQRAAPVEVTPAAAGPMAVAAGTAVEAVQPRFPEERTMALMAEDLLGRPLDERAPSMTAPIQATGVHASAWTARPATRSADIWDAAMPLVAEG
jgi:hypothetical protein